jgi:ribosomal protein L11 methyltransferase
VTFEQDGRFGSERKPWIAVRIENIDDRDTVARVLFDEGSQGVQEDGTALVTHFPPDHDINRVTTALRSVDRDVRITVSEAPQPDWSLWRASVRSHVLGRITVVPPWLFHEANPAHVVVEPAMAFGTGEHPTTRGVIRLMQRLPSIPAVVADLGAGSAVLSIAAAKLGAKRAIAIELDADAIGNAEENVRANRVDETVHVIEGDASVLLPLVAPVGLVLANIISSVLIEILPVIHASLESKGHAILSGILVDEKDRMLSELAGDWSVVSTDTEEGWWSVLIERRR